MTLSDLLVDEDGHDCGSLDIGEECLLTGTHTVTQAEVDAGVVTNTVTAEANELTTAVTATQQTDVAQERALTLTRRHRYRLHFCRGNHRLQLRGDQ